MDQQDVYSRSFYESRIWKSHVISNPYEIARVQYIQDFLDEGSGTTVLDAGCGGGTYTSFLVEASPLIATDISFSAVNAAKQNLRLYDNVFFVVCDLTHLPFRDAAVDKVACIDVLEHVEEPQKALDEMSRVLRSGGQMLLFTACGENKLTLEHILKPLFGRLINSIRSRFGHVSIFTTAGIREMLSRDFLINRIEYMHHWAGWLLKFFWDVKHMNSLESHQALLEQTGSSLSRILWLPLEAEFRFFRSRSIGTEAAVKATKKRY